MTVAFLAGTLVRRLGLPPMVGFLIAGFLMRAGGVESPEGLEGIADFGVTLLLFTIGLKLKVRSLARPEVWAGTSFHMVLTTLILGSVALGFGVLGLPLFAELNLKTALMVGFALSFSSTVFTAKVFEDRAELATRHATTAIGILIMQDVIAVIFLTLSSGEVPSAWAFVLLLLPLLRPLVTTVLERVGHGELLLLFGFVMTFGGYHLFDSLGLKGDLGAIAFGMLMASSPKAEELAKVLFGFKDLLLVAFFLSIGLREDISPSVLVAAVVLVPFLIPKGAGFFGILCGFRSRARPAFLAGLGLANFSEFGLIVALMAVNSGWLPGEWLAVIAVVVALSFVGASPLNALPYRLFDHLEGRLRRFERKVPVPEDTPISIGTCQAVVFGMGRIGVGVYDWLTEEKGLQVIGVDSSEEVVREQNSEGRRVLLGDGTDPGFWERVDAESRPKLVFVATRNFIATRRIAKRLLVFSPEARITAVVQHKDEADELTALGVTAVYDIYRKAGEAFAADFWEASEPHAGPEKVSPTALDPRLG